MLSLEDLFKKLNGPPEPAKTLYLPLRPRAKNLRAQIVPIPCVIIDELIANAPSVLFPFALRKPGSPSSQEEFNAVVERMRDDRESVIWAQDNIVATADATEAHTRVEYCFSQSLRERIAASAAKVSCGGTDYFEPLADLVMQAEQRRDAADVYLDEFRSCWVTIRGEEPWRDGGAYSEVTILIQYPVRIIRVIFGETESDLDNWYRYEWILPSIRALHLSRFRRPANR